MLIVMTGMAATVQMTSAAENSSAKKSENTSTSLKEAQQEKAALEKALEKAKQMINELKESKGDVQAKVNDLNTQLMNISCLLYTSRQPDLICVCLKMLLHLRSHLW